MVSTRAFIKTHANKCNTTRTEKPPTIKVYFNKVRVSKMP